MNGFDASTLLRQDLLNFPPYRMAAVKIADMDRVIKLDANENAFGPSPKALAGLAAMRHWNRYATQDELRPAIASYVGVDPAHIVVGNGGDELLDLLERAFLNRGDAIVDLPPSFEMYAKYAEVNGGRVIAVPRRADFSIDVDTLKRVVAQDKPKIIFVANPNNPTGTLLSREEIERVLALPALVVLDEAYAEFAGESYVDRVPTQPNLFVLRSFSKWASLAGLRIGYGVAPVRIADQLFRNKSPYNVNAAAIVAAQASLEDKEYLLANVRRVVAERERLTDALTRLGYLQPFPSRTNFILCRVKRCDARGLRDALAERNILIRAVTNPQLRDCIRISVGTPEQNATLLRALEELTPA